MTLYQNDLIKTLKIIVNASAGYFEAVLRLNLEAVLSKVSFRSKIEGHKNNNKIVFL